MTWGKSGVKLRRTWASPCLGLPCLRGKTTSLLLYSFNRSTLIVCPSSDLLRLR